MNPVKLEFNSKMLKELMDERMLTPKNMSDAFRVFGERVTKASIHNWLNGGSPRVETVLALSEFFGVTMEVFFIKSIPNSLGINRSDS